VNKFLILVVLSVFVSCDDAKTFDSYKTLTNKAWGLDVPIVFKVAIDDVSHKHHVFLNIRTDNDYLYRNLYVLSKLTLPNKTVVQDTLEYEMTDAFGNWLGQGLTDVRDNKLYFLENYQFPEKGVYQFEFTHGMRKRNDIEGVPSLTGITDIGLRIENLSK